MQAFASLRAWARNKWLSSSASTQQEQPATGHHVARRGRGRPREQPKPDEPPKSQSEKDKMPEILRFILVDGDKLDVDQYDVPMSEFRKETQRAIREGKIPNVITEYNCGPDASWYKEFTGLCPSVSFWGYEDEDVDKLPENSDQFKETRSTDASHVRYVIVVVLSPP